jgi:hypothetical protein
VAAMFYVAAIVGAVVSFLVGCLWYSVLFGKKWQALMGFSDEQVKKIFVPKRIICAFVCEWFSAACLTGILSNLPINIWIGALMAAVFLIFSGIKLGIFDGKKPAAILINAGYMLLSVVIMAASISVFL